MELKYWASTDVGRKRSHNEDNFLIDKDLRLFIVADGMGGHATGEVASAMAVHTIRSILLGERDLLEAHAEQAHDPAYHVEVCKLLEYAIHTACADIFDKGRKEPEKKGMGTTVVALLLIGDRGYIAYVGDSRLYLLRGGIVYQLTEDHSLMNELIRQGKITADEFDDSPYANFRNAMTRAVGPHEMVEVDTLDFDMVPGDAFLLCSDGLYEYLDDEDIARTLCLPDVEDITRRFIDLANTRGGKDNITALVVQSLGEAGEDDRAAELNLTLDTLKRVPLFSQLTYQQLVRIMNVARIQPFYADDVLCREGDVGNELYILVRGHVALSARGNRFATLEPGSHFGEMALLDDEPRSATATALEDGKLIAITRADFHEILRKEAPLGVKLLWSFLNVLGSRLRSTNLALHASRAAQEDEILELDDAELVTESGAYPTLTATDRDTRVDGKALGDDDDAPVGIPDDDDEAAAPSPVVDELTRKLS